MNIGKSIYKTSEPVDRTSRYLPLVLRSLLLSTGLILTGVPSPAAADSVGKLLESDSNLSIFYHAIMQSDLGLTLEKSQSISLFVPSNESLKTEGSAFLLESVLLAPANEERLLALLSYHIVPGTPVDINLIPESLTLTTLASACLPMDRMNTAIKIGADSFITKAITADNGMIYLIDRMLWQPYEGSHCLAGKKL